MSKEIDITEEQFRHYEVVRQSGLTNMINVGLVSELTDSTCSKKDVLTIIGNYTKLTEMYPNVRTTDE